MGNVRQPRALAQTRAPDQQQPGTPSAAPWLKASAWPAALVVLGRGGELAGNWRRHTRPGRLAAAQRPVPWFALVYGLYPRLLIALQRDLAEPLCYALVALAIYLLDTGGSWRILWAGISFAGAMLARESTAVFALVYGLALLTGAAFPVRLEGPAGRQLAAGGAALLAGLRPAGGVQSILAALASLSRPASRSRAPTPS